MDAHLHQPGDNLSGISDHDLLSLIDAGTAGAFAELYRRHCPEALAFVSGQLGAAAARDAVNDAFLSVLTSILIAGSTDDEGRDEEFDSHLHAALRSEIATRAGSGRDTSGMPAEAAAPLDPHLAAAALSELPDNWQRILWLREVARLSPRAIADRLGITPTAVTQLTLRARRGLQEAWLRLRASSAGADRQSAPVEPGNGRPSAGPAAGGHCLETIPRLGEYVSGRMGPLRRRTVRAHLDDCADCSAVAAEVAEISKRCRAVLIPALLISPIVIERLADTVAATARPGAPAGIVMAEPEETDTASSAAPPAAGLSGESAAPAGATAAPTAPPTDSAPADSAPVGTAIDPAAATAAANRRPARLPKSVLIPAAVAALALAATLLGVSLATPETADAGYHSGEAPSSAPSEAAPAPATRPADEDATPTPTRASDENSEQVVEADEKPAAPEPRERADDRESPADETHEDSATRPSPADSDRGGSDSGRRGTESGPDDERGELEETPWVGPTPDDDPGASAPADEPSDSAPAPEPPPSDPSPAPEPPSAPAPGDDSTGSTPGQVALTS